MDIVHVAGRSTYDPTSGGAQYGAVVVVARNVDRPAGPALRKIIVDLEPAGGARRAAPHRGTSSDSTGIVQLDSVTPGAYRLRVRAIGYRPGVLPVDVPRGCAVQVEAYLGRDPTLLSDAGDRKYVPPERFTVSVCAPET